MLGGAPSSSRNVPNLGSSLSESAYRVVALPDRAPGRPEPARFGIARALCHRAERHASRHPGERHGGKFRGLADKGSVAESSGSFRTFLFRFQTPSTKLAPPSPESRPA